MNETADLSRRIADIKAGRNISEHELIEEDNKMKAWEEMTEQEKENEFSEICEDIARECEEEGYPAHGENYDLRVAQARAWYFGEEE